MALLAPAVKIDKLMAERSMHMGQRDKHGDRIVRDYTRAIDTLTDWKTVPSGTRRAAIAGKQLMAIRYAENSGALRKIMRLWHAAFIYPKIFGRYPLGGFIPGWYAIRRRLVACARLLGFPQSSAQ